jgi:succinyl-CoA synthetase beta subunit
VLSALRIPLPATVIVAPDSVATIDGTTLSGVRFPVALKVVSLDIPHKTEAGGVALGIASIEALGAAAARMLDSVRRKCPHARIDGLEVQTMESGLAEVLIGYRLDPQVGPTITIGSGGVLSELLRDVATRVAPISVDEAVEMIGEVRSLQVLTGFRSLPKGDVAALARTISVVSSLALLEDGPIREFEINPLLVKREGVVALDALVVCDAEGGS